MFHLSHSFTNLVVQTFLTNQVFVSINFFVQHRGQWLYMMYRYHFFKWDAKDNVPPVAIYICYCAVTLYIIKYIYYKILKTQICLNKAEPTIENNFSMFIIIAVVSFKSSHCPSNSQIGILDYYRSLPNKGGAAKSTLRSQFAFRLSLWCFFWGWTIDSSWSLTFHQPKVVRSNIFGQSVWYNKFNLYCITFLYNKTQEEYSF